MIFQIIIYGLIPVKSVRLSYDFNKIPVVRKLTIRVLTFIFLVSPTKIKLFPNILNQCVREPVRESVLCNETVGTC